jgi:hypothetical protein
MVEWIYTTNNDNSARYTLGKLGQKMLVFIGINPSTAKPDDLDRTVARVENFAEYYKYDGWLMLNVYPQRATNPKDIHKEFNKKIHQENIQQIKRFVEANPNFDVCAGWGTEIDRRKYLKDCLRDMAMALGLEKKWIHLHELTKYQHPRHPLYLPNDALFLDFDIKNYLNL